MKKKVTWKHTHSTNEHSYNFIKEKLLSIDLHMNYNSLFFFSTKTRLVSRFCVLLRQGAGIIILFLSYCSENCWWFLYKIYNLVNRLLYELFSIIFFVVVLFFILDCFWAGMQTRKLINLIWFLKWIIYSAVCI